MELMAVLIDTYKLADSNMGYSLYFYTYLQVRGPYTHPYRHPAGHHRPAEWEDDR